MRRMVQSRDRCGCDEIICSCMWKQKAEQSFLSLANSHIFVRFSCFLKRTRMPEPVEIVATIALQGPQTVSVTAFRTLLFQELPAGVDGMYLKKK